MNQDNLMRQSIIEQGDRGALPRVLENVLNAQSQSQSSKEIPNLKIDPPSDKATAAAVRLQEANLWVHLKSSSAEYIIPSPNNPFVLVGGSRRRTVTVSFGGGGLSVRINGVLVGSNAYTGDLTPSTQAVVLGAGNALSTAGTTNSLNIPFQGILHSWSLTG